MVQMYQDCYVKYQKVINKEKYSHIRWIIWRNDLIENKSIRIIERILNFITIEREY